MFKGVTDSIPQSLSHVFWCTIFILILLGFFSHLYILFSMIRYILDNFG